MYFNALAVGLRTEDGKIANAKGGIMNRDEDQGRLNRRAFLAGTAATIGIHGARSATANQSASKPARPTASIRVAQIGFQGHYNHIFQGVEQLKECELVAAARSMPDEDLNQIKKKWPKQLAKMRLYDDYRKMLDEVKPDVVAIFMPFARNSEASIEAVRRGCHVISEKPLAVELEDLELLKKERDKAGVQVTAILPYRIKPAFLAAQKAVQEGAIGESLLISAQKSYRWGPNRPEFYKRRKTYGGTIPWVAIHAIDLIRGVSGLEFANVTARHAVKVHKDYPECEDCGALLFEMTNGGQAVLTFDYLRPNRAPSHGDDWLRVVGSTGVVEVRCNRESFCELITNQKSPYRLSLPESDPNAFIPFIKSIRGEGEHFLTLEDPFRATEVAIKARQAADSKQTIGL